ncbi:hypothetical protein COL516b_002758 [Colletotrichum fioriniae]|nr:uncharacterized protein COL516b_002758 [Colletotrichum fioriniae]KAJ0309513.1 hypothetical protein COL516b_002758 [Colletotrichum fioriniae]
MSTMSEHTLSEVPTRKDELPPDLLALRTSNAEKGVNIIAQTPSRPYSYREDETVYDRFTPGRKRLITAIVSFGGLGINLASLLVLSALPEVAAAFNTTGTVINFTNALFLLMMGIGVLFWGPLSQVYGRKWGALGGAAMVLAVAFLPETSHGKWSEELEGMTTKEKIGQIWEWANPFRVINLFRYPKILIVGVAASSVLWNMQVLLTPVRYVINPRFHLTSPLQSGFFFLAPGAGYLVGTFFGGRYADYTVKKWIAKRGRRIPEDRLRSAFIALGVVIPATTIIYGWAIDKAKGGIPLPVICMFLQGVAQMVCFPCLNSYCLDVFRERAAEVMGRTIDVRK